MSDIDVESSDAWSQKDKEMIFDACRAHEGGFKGLNSLVKALLRDWLADTAKAALLQGDSDHTLMTQVASLMRGTTSATIAAR